VSVAKAWAHVLQSDIAVAQSTQAVLPVFKTLFVEAVLQVPVHVVAPAVVVHAVQSAMTSVHIAHPVLSDFTYLFGVTVVHVRHLSEPSQVAHPALVFPDEHWQVAPNGIDEA